MAWTESVTFQNDTMNARSKDAFATAYGWQATINGLPNPETKAQHRARKVKEYIKEITKAEEKKVALAAVADPTIQD